MISRIKRFALASGTAQRSARANYASEFARPTIEERIVRFLRRQR